jgi:hypothetical protein
MTARYPLVRVGADISELPAGDTLLGVSGGGSTDAVKMHRLIKNNTGITLLKGQAVYIDGATGVNVTVALAQANAESTSSKTLGLIEADILNGSTGYVVTDGELIDFDTSSATNEGDSVWLSPTVAGGLVYGLANKPVAPYHMVYLGVVSRKNVNDGVILVKVQNGYELNELHNVLLTSVLDKQLLKYDSVTSLWKNDVITYSEISGTVPVWNQNTTGYSAGIAGGLIGSIPYQSAVNTTAFLAAGTSGYILKANGAAAPSWLQTLPIANGGTGATTLAGANLPVTNVANTFTGTQTFSGTSTTLAAIFTNAAETTTVSATAATGTIAYYTASQSVLYYTTNASANWTLNIRHSVGTTLNTAMSVGQSITTAFLVTQGSTAFYNSSVQVDGTTTGVTTKWQGGTAPTSGNTSAIDVYQYTIIKTAAATFTVLASVTKYA